MCNTCWWHNHKTYSDNLRVRHVATHAITPIHKNPSGMLEANHAGTLPATSETANLRIHFGSHLDSPLITARSPRQMPCQSPCQS